MIEPIKHIWGLKESKELNYSKISQLELVKAYNRFINGVNNNEFLPLIGVELKTSDKDIWSRGGLINGCFVTIGENKEIHNPVYLRVVAEPSNQKGFDETLECLSLSL